MRRNSGVRFITCSSAKKLLIPISFTGRRKLKIRTVAASISHTSLRAVCMRRNYLSRRFRGLRITEAYTAGLLTDYMCLIQNAFPGIFFELRYRLCFYFERELYFSLTRKTVFSKKTALSCIFFRISIDNLGPYMCYVSYIILLFPKLHLEHKVCKFSITVSPPFDHGMI